MDKSITYFNIIMKCPDAAASKVVVLPEGYSFKYYEPGDEEYWADIEASVGEFNSQGEALAYFYENYIPHIDELESRCIFIVDASGRPVGTCTAWREENNGAMVNSLHWLAAYPAYQGLGMGKALVSKVMDIYRELGDFTMVYLHTQTWSYKAIGIYLKAGFAPLRIETLSNYRNDFDDSARVLLGVMPKDLYEIFINTAI